MLNVPADPIDHGTVIANASSAFLWDCVLLKVVGRKLAHCRLTANRLIVGDRVVPFRASARMMRARSRALWKVRSLKKLGTDDS